MQAHWRWVALSLAWIASSGCATLNIPWASNSFPKASARNPVVQIVCLWEPAEGRDPNNVPCRGFAGQIMFLGNRHATPVEVDGDVRIYLFDDVGTVDEQAKPVHQFDFDHGSWKVHLTKSAVGASYSVFVPYTRRGEHNPKCSLRVRLTPKSGPTIFSDVTTLPLRGLTNPSETTIVSEVPFDEQRAQPKAVRTPSRLADKSSTIPLAVSSTGKLSIDKHRTAEPAPRPDQAAPASADDRLARMEKLLEQMMMEKAQPPQSPKPLSAVQQAGFEELSTEPADDADAPRRFKLNRAD